MFTKAVLALVNAAYDLSDVGVAAIVDSSLFNAFSISVVLDEEPATPIIAAGGRTATTTVVVSDAASVTPVIPVIVNVAFALSVRDVAVSAFLIVMPFITISNFVPNAICAVLPVSADAVLNTGVNVTDVDVDDTLNEDTGLLLTGGTEVTVATQFEDVSVVGNTIPAVVSCEAVHDNDKVPFDGISIPVVIENVKLTSVKSVDALDGGLRRVELLRTGSIVRPSIY
jgi:hypothetical protein